MLNGEVVTGAVVLVVLSLLVTDNDVLGVTPNRGIVMVGATGKTFSLVIAVGLVTGVDALGSLATTSSSLLDDTGSFAGVIVGSIARLKER